jgi:hypothetical protein
LSHIPRSFFSISWECPGELVKRRIDRGPFDRSSH